MNESILQQIGRTQFFSFCYMNVDQNPGVIAPMTLAPAAPPLLEVHGMEVAYGKFPVLRGVSLDVRAGEVVALVGPYGTGKTTLLEALVGLRRRDAGTLRCAARELRHLPDFCAVFSYMPDDAALPAEVQVAALLAQTQRCSGAPPELATELLGPLGLLPLRDARFDELSRGERRRMALFVALCTRRPVIYLADLQPQVGLPSFNPDVEQGVVNVNLFLRWEFLLDSTLYLVYARSQQPGVSLAPGDPASSGCGPSLAHATALRVGFLRRDQIEAVSALLASQQRATDELGEFDGREHAR